MIENSGTLDRLIVDTSDGTIAFRPPVGKEQQYYGHHVAISSLVNPVVLAHDENLANVSKKLDQLGKPENLVIYMSKPEEELTYRAA